MIAAAADLRYALDEITALYRGQWPDAGIEVIYGSSGKMTTQIMNGAPYDIFFSADIAFPERLHREGFAPTEPRVYAIGRIVIWSKRHDASTMTLHDLMPPKIRRIAIAQPTHAPYGQRAQEALMAAGLWEDIQPKLVFGENIAHAAQMAESEAADAGIIALSLALFPALARHGYHLIDDALHEPLIQGYVVTRHGQDNAMAHDFARYMMEDDARAIMEKYGFVLPGREQITIHTQRVISSEVPSPARVEVEKSQTPPTRRRPLDCAQRGFGGHRNRIPSYSSHWNTARPEPRPPSHACDSGMVLHPLPCGERAGVRGNIDHD